MYSQLYSAYLAVRPILCYTLTVGLAAPKAHEEQQSLQGFLLLQEKDSLSLRQTYEPFKRANSGLGLARRKEVAQK